MTGKVLLQSFKRNKGMTSNENMLKQITDYYTTQGRLDGSVTEGIDPAEVGAFLKDFLEISGPRKAKVLAGNFQGFPGGLLDHYFIFSNALISAPYLDKDQVKAVLHSFGFKFEMLDFPIWSTSAAGFVVYFGKNDLRYQLKRFVENGSWTYRLMRR